MSLEERLNVFAEKHALDRDAVAELLKIWNITLVDVAHGLLEKSTTNNSTPKQLNTERKWASKTAKEHAEENHLTLDDFTQDKVSKRDVEQCLKKNQGVKKRKG